MAFGQISSLIANYDFTLGDCHAGALRWSVHTDAGNLFVYYGALPNFTNCTTDSQTGDNLVGLTDPSELRYDTSQIGGTFYDTYGHALALLQGHTVSYVALVLDAGWAGNQRLTLGNVSVNDATWTPPPASSSFTPICNLPAATIRLTHLDGQGAGVVDETPSVGAADSGNAFRVVDCKYMYNLSTRQLTSGNTYTVDVIINGDAASQPLSTSPLQMKAQFGIR